jgi:hypothetical protein
MKQDLLSYSDVAKLLIPFIFALILIWAKDYYEKSRERKSKNEHIWRVIKQSFDDCRKGIDVLNETIEFLKENIIVFFALDIPQTVTDYAKRLSELEMKSSYLYSDFASKAEIIRNGHKTLQAILTQASFQDLSDSQKSDRIKKAILSQINALKKDFISLAEVELDLMNHIQQKYSKKDVQDINKMEQILRDARNKM